MAVDQGFNAVRNELAAGQGIFHALVTHGDSIANADGRHFNGNAAGGQDAVFDKLRLVVQMGVAGNDVILGVDYGDHRFLHVLFRKAQRVKQGPVGGAGGPFFDLITSQTTHVNPSFLSLCFVFF